MAERKTIHRVSAMTPLREGKKVDRTRREAPVTSHVNIDISEGLAEAWVLEGVEQ
jgi:hypothetical protein